MLHVSTQKLIIKLCELTAQGDVQWREGVDGAAVFETEGYAVEVASHPARLRVLNADGNELERVDADSLAAAPWPDGEGSFADHVSTMAGQAQRLARGTDHAISRILSSLSAPASETSPPDQLLEIETVNAATASAAGGQESDAAKTAAVADMATRSDLALIEEAKAAPAAPAPEPAPEPVAAPAAAPAAATAIASADPGAPPEPEEKAAPSDPEARAAEAPIEPLKRSSETFGRTRSFAIAGRTHHRSTPGARPISSLGKITASGLVMMGMPTATPQLLETRPIEPEPEQISRSPVALVEALIAPPRPVPAPTPPDAYKPWI
jgi:hypothetical protein